jgi:hypothetical protein
MCKSEKLCRDLLADMGETEIDEYVKKAETKRRAVVDMAVEEVFAARFTFWTCPGGYHLKELYKLALIHAECRLLKRLALQCIELDCQAMFLEHEERMKDYGATRAPPIV